MRVVNERPSLDGCVWRRSIYERKVSPQDCACLYFSVSLFHPALNFSSPLLITLGLPLLFSSRSLAFLAQFCAPVLVLRFTEKIVPLLNQATLSPPLSLDVPNKKYPRFYPLSLPCRSLAWTQVPSILWHLLAPFPSVGKPKV